MDKDLIKIAKITLKNLNNKTWNSINHEEIIYQFKNKNIIKKISSKRDLLININRYFDLQLKELENSIEQSNQKDMIFETMMMRFDILQSHRKSIINIFDSFKIKPQELLLIIPSFVESMIMMSKISKISLKGIKGNLIIKSLLIVYFSSFLVWIKDKSSSLEKTMTSLDSNLNRANNLLRMF